MMTKSSSYSNLIEVIVAFVIAFLIIHFCFSGDEDFEDLALGKNTSSYYAEDNKFIIHAGEISPYENKSMLDGWNNRGSKPVLLYLGNSQTHGINQMQSDDVSVNHLFLNSSNKCN